MIREINRCRVCDNTELVPVIDLGEQYLTGVFPRHREAVDLDQPPPSGPV